MSVFVVTRVCDADLEDTTRTTVNLHFTKVHPSENFASQEDIPKSRWERSSESDKSADDTEEEEKVKVRKRERSPAADQNQNQTKKIASSVRVLNILNIDVNEASTDADNEADGNDKLRASSTKSLIVELSPKNDGSLARDRDDDEMSPDHRKYAGALIPLPYIDFPRKEMFYSCTVCPAEPTFTNLSQFEKHRESDKHRIMYGERFRGNNCQHFPDGAHYNGRVDLSCCYCPAKVGVGGVGSLRFAGLTD